MRQNGRFSFLYPTTNYLVHSTFAHHLNGGLISPFGDCQQRTAETRQKSQSTFWVLIFFFICIIVHKTPYWHINMDKKWFSLEEDFRIGHWLCKPYLMRQNDPKTEKAQSLKMTVRRYEGHPCMHMQSYHGVRCVSASPLCLYCFSPQPHSCRCDSTMTGTDTTTVGRGVSGQAAGYPIMLAMLLHPFPSTLPSSQIQWEANRGQAVSSLCHYSSITCLPPSADNRTFPLSLHFRPAHHDLSPFSFFFLFDYSLIIFTSFNHPSALEFSLFSLPLVSFCFLLVLHYFYRFRELLGPAFWDLLLTLQLISRLLQRDSSPTATFTGRLQIELTSFRCRSLLNK